MRCGGGVRTHIGLSDTDVLYPASPGTRKRQTQQKILILERATAMGPAVCIPVRVFGHLLVRTEKIFLTFPNGKMAKKAFFPTKYAHFKVKNLVYTFHGNCCGFAGNDFQNLQI